MCVENPSPSSREWQLLGILAVLVFLLTALVVRGADDCKCSTGGVCSCKDKCSAGGCGCEDCTCAVGFVVKAGFTVANKTPKAKVKSGKRVAPPARPAVRLRARPPALSLPRSC